MNESAATPDNPNDPPDPENSAPVEPEASQFTPEQAERVHHELRAEQSLVGAIAAGSVAALISAVIWAAITVSTGYQIGWIAIGVGFLVGFAVRAAGKGIDPTFSIIGAVLALLGCLLGNVFSIAGYISSEGEIGIFDALGRMTPEVTIDAMKAWFSPIDLAFYAIAAYQGYKFSIRQVSAEDLQRHAAE